MKTVIFACVHSAGRSQMAAALFRSLADPAKATAEAAGTEPADRVHPIVVTALQEVGIEVTAPPQRLTDELAGRADLLITMGCGEACPFVPGLRTLDWPLPDPKGQPIEAVRAIREQIRARVVALIETEGWTG